MNQPNTKWRRKISSAARAAAAVAPRPTGILVVENDPDLQWTLARQLTVQGNRVVGTSSGEGALALIEQWPVGMVLVDEELPGIDGLELAKRLREHYPHIPVVLMTGELSPEMQVAARLVGAVATLTKPFRREAIAELLTRVQVTVERTSSPPPEPAE
ncbi:MAG: response regulator [Myxococcota bacterium]